MPLYLKPISYIEADLGINPGGRVHKFFTAECARQMDPFVPFDKGNLAGTVIENGQITSNVKTDTITYAQPYAIYVYNGITHGKEMTFHKDKHHLATNYWDKHMWTAKKDDIVKAVQDYVDNGGKE